MKSSELARGLRGLGPCRQFDGSKLKGGGVSRPDVHQVRSDLQETVACATRHSCQLRNCGQRDQRRPSSDQAEQIDEKGETV